ncbi:MAG: hypothetical protein HOF02_00400, partial [Gammaproteobacteria bacterium]|nr:hypothetical protein [Gammaproteobacteria bacterium]
MIEYIQNKPKSVQNIISVLIVLFLAILHFITPPEVATLDSLMQVD